MRAIVRLVIVAAVVVGARPAAAGSKVVVDAYGGYGAYTQEDVNAIVDLINSRAGDQAVDRLKGGLELGGHLGMRINDTAILGVGYSRLRASTAGSYADEALDVDAPADVWLLFGNWLPDNDRPARLGLGLEAGFVTAKGTSRYTPTGAAAQVEHWKGNGLFLALYLVGDADLGAGLHLVADGGFRLAQVPDITIDGESSSSKLDYSGIFGRVGLRYAP